MHIQCMAHVINLVVQAFLFAIDEGDDPDVEDWYELNKDAPIHYDISKDKEQEALDNEGLDGDGEEDNGMWDLSAEDVADEMSPEVRMEPEEMLTVEEVGNGGPITRVCFSNASLSHKCQDSTYFGFP
jgi:hypothetical protein